jgi:hypothetical protein
MRRYYALNTIEIAIGLCEMVVEALQAIVVGQKTRLLLG